MTTSTGRSRLYGSSSHWLTPIPRVNGNQEKGNPEVSLNPLKNITNPIVAWIRKMLFFSRLWDCLSNRGLWNKSGLRILRTFSSFAFFNDFSEKIFAFWNGFRKKIGALSQHEGRTDDSCGNFSFFSPLLIFFSAAFVQRNPLARFLWSHNNFQFVSTSWCHVLDFTKIPFTPLPWCPRTK